MRPSSTSTDKAILDYARDLIAKLRIEADEVRQCFTKQAHQTLVFSSAILGVTFAATSNGSGAITFVPYLSIILIIFLSHGACRVGTHKYTTANRITAYQLHISRVLDYEEMRSRSSLFHAELLKLDWEEALFTWRIVQPVIYDYFYPKRFWFWHYEKYKDMLYPWFDSDLMLKKCPFQTSLWGSLKGQNPRFYPGTYLRKKLWEFYAVILSMFLLSAIISIKAFYSHQPFPLFTLGICGLLVIYGTYIMGNALNTFFKCKIVESGLLSIQTGAVIWRIVAVSHLVAKYRSCFFNRGNPSATENQLYRGLTIRIAEIACLEIRPALQNIHEWLEKAEEDLETFLKDFQRTKVPSLIGPIVVPRTASHVRVPSLVPVP
jgi:hypothetical protein